MDNLRAYPIYLGIRGSFAFFFTLWATVAAVYRIEVVHIDPLRLVLLGTALEVAVFLTMPERNFRPSPREGRSSLHHAATTARSGVRLVRSRPVLLMLLAAALFAGMSEEGFDRLNPKQFLDVVGLPSVGGLDPVIWFGVIGAGGLVLSYLAAGIVARNLDVSSPAVAARLLLTLDALTMAGMLAFALAGSFAFALGTFWFASLVRRVAEPVYLTWINEGLEPGVRATVISMSSQSGALGEASAGPVIGAIGNIFGVRPALTVAAVILSPTLLLYVRAMKRPGVDPGAKDAKRVE
jgi:MFS transporter, DHA3 family, tetracycline resistance protein